MKTPAEELFEQMLISGTSLSGSIPKYGSTGPDPDSIAAQHMEAMENWEPTADDYEEMMWGD